MKFCADPFGPVRIAPAPLGRCNGKKHRLLSYTIRDILRYLLQKQKETEGRRNAKKKLQENSSQANIQGTVLERRACGYAGSTGLTSGDKRLVAKPCSWARHTFLWDARHGLTVGMDKSLLRTD